MRKRRSERLSPFPFLPFQPPQKCMYIHSRTKTRSHTFPPAKTWLRVRLVVMSGLVVIMITAVVVVVVIIGIDIAVVMALIEKDIDMLRWWLGDSLIVV